MRRHRWLLWLTVLTLLLPVCSLSEGLPVITQFPFDQTVPAGGSFTLTAAAQGAESVSWRLVNSETGEMLNASQAARRFPGLSVNDYFSASITFAAVPKELDGWEVFCRFTNSAGFVDTPTAILHVTGEGGQPSVSAAGLMPDNELVPTGRSEDAQPAERPKVVRAVGAVLQRLNDEGRATGETFTEIDLTKSPEGKATFAITADLAKGQSVDYWLIDGVRYDFVYSVKTFTVYGWSEPAVFEAVPKNADSRSQPFGPPPEEERIVSTVNARLYFPKANGKNGSGPYTRFDFTHDYTNPYSGQTEAGGHITIRVVAVVPNGGRQYAYGTVVQTQATVLGWRFNDARLYFSSNITSFIVRGLDRTMEYEPIFSSARRIQTQYPPIWYN